MMKRKYILVNIVASAVVLAMVSWGYVGHQVVARVAENHLSPQAKAAVHALLGSESITEIASWADEARNQPEYKATASWHFLNLPLGLNRAGFEKAVRTQTKENVYSAILAQEKVLSDNSASREQKVTALKFLVHFAGDAHQPMHISRAEDKGGNTVQVQFEGRGTNLHSLWDSRLIDKEGLGYSELASKVDQASPAIIKQAANTDPMEWVWESYQVSSKLYPEVEKSNKLGEDYYQGHIAVVNERLELAGLRLAEVLNALFKNAVIPIASASSAAKSTALSSAPGKAESQLAEAKTAAVNIDVKDAASHLGQMVTLSAKAFGHRDMQSFVLVNLGAEYPNQLVTLLLRSKAKDLAGNIDGKTVTVTGKLIDFKGKPEIEVREVADISVK